MDYDVERCSRHCAVTGRQFAEGEEFYSALVNQGANVVRLDYTTAAWTGPPDQALGWWRSRMPRRDDRKSRLAPNDVLLQLLSDLETRPQGLEMRYVMALLLVRRRVLRLEEHQHDEHGREFMVLYCPKDESTHRVAVESPDGPRIQQIQAELERLLFESAAP